ncbi:hypothetical protein F4861DRAFT_369582 [Xylaria intraflava]|nr:hypothetical protein F4861DRAFT_369582 [Xylaria intraflava]
MTDRYTDYLTRQNSDIQRLNDQLDVMTDNIGYLLHPSITSSLPENPSIADVATGTGRFLLLVRDSYPNGTFTGLDISSANYPSPTDLPGNVNMTLLDVKKPIPEDLHGKYDVVHVRILVAAMLPEDWDPTVANLSLMLKPGGYLQWTECDCISMKHLRGKAESRVENLRFLGRAFTAALSDRLRHGWNTLPGHMEAAGLRPVLRDIVSSDRLPETRERATVNSNLAFLSTMRVLSKKGAPGAMTSEEIDALETKVHEEIRSGAYLRYDIHVIVGRKPL